MKRRQLFEFGDQRWLPKAFRDYLTNILSFQAGHIYRYALPTLIQALQHTKSKTILDLCSGTGGPWPVLAPLLNESAPYPIHITLSDKYPPKNISSNNKNTFLNYHSEAIDILEIPEGLSSFRTLFTGLHHFSPEQAKSILAKAVKENSAIAIFEFTERKQKNIKAMWKAPALVFRLTRQLKNLSWGQWFWTYIIPIVPLLYSWDGMVSHWRSYNIEEMNAMTKQLEPSTFKWKCDYIALPNSEQRISFLIGLPSNVRQSTTPSSPHQLQNSSN